MRRALGPSVYTVLATMAVLFALAGYQVTSEVAATRLLSRLAATLVEVDRWLPAHSQDIELLAQDKPQGNVELSDLPLNVSLPASQVINDANDPAALRTLIVQQMGRSLYDNGSAAFETDTESGHLSLTDPVRWTVTLLDSSRHGFWLASLALVTLVLLASLAAVLMSGGAPLTPLAVGAGAAAAVSLAVWLLMTASRATFGNPVDQEIALIVRSGAWIGLRNALAVMVAAGCLSFLMVRPGQRLQAASSWPAPPTLPPDR